jgi:hypothetical protein
MVLLSITHKSASIVLGSWNRVKSLGNRIIKGVSASQQFNQKRIVFPSTFLIFSIRNFTH